MIKRQDVIVVHTLHSMRYVQSPQRERLPALNGELELGAVIVAAYAKRISGLDFPYRIATGRHVDGLE